MLHLYDSTISGNCYKVRLLLSQLGIPYTKEEVDVIERSNRLQELGDKSPLLRVPLLRLEDGSHLGESGAILFHLAEGSDYLPQDARQRAEVLKWMFFEQNNLEPNIAVVLYWYLIREQPDAYPEAMAQRREGGDAALDILQRHLSEHDFLVDGRYTIADIAMFGYTHKAALGPFDLDARPALQAWLERVAKQPGYVPMMPPAAPPLAPPETATPEA